MVRITKMKIFMKSLYIFLRCKMCRKLHMLMHPVLYVIYVCIIIFIQKVISSNKIKVTIIPYIHQKTTFFKQKRIFYIHQKKKKFFKWKKFIISSEKLISLYEEMYHIHPKELVTLKGTNTVSSRARRTFCLRKIYSLETEES